MRLLFFVLLLCCSIAVYAQSYSTGVPLPGLPISVGPKTMAGSTSVTIATDQTPVPITGTVNGALVVSNASVGPNGATAPTQSELIGFIDANGNLQPFRGDTNNGITVTAKQGTTPWVVSGGVAITNTATVNQGTNPWVISGGVAITTSATVNQGTTPWVISGGTAITNTPTVNQGTNPWNISGGVAITNTPTVVANQGTNPWVISGGTAITNTPTVNQGTNPWIISGGVAITQTVSTSVITRVANSVASQTLATPNASRKALFLFNDSATTNCYVKMGATASLIDFTIKMFATDTYIMDAPRYIGVIDYICDAASGNMEVTEQ